MTSTPVVLIGFNRPTPTARTMAAIRAARPPELFLIADGPRPGHSDDQRLCAEVRATMEQVDWPCTVHRRFSETNLGCEANVELGLDWVFGQVDRAVVLEDDCVPDLSFFRFAEELLDLYCDDHRVWQIAGNSHSVPAALFGGDSYRFASWGSVWGWATWADRWHRHREVFPRDHRAVGGRTGHEPRRTSPAEPRPGSLVTRGGRWHFRDAARSDDIVTHWWLTMLSEGGMAATPSVNMVENVGFGADATHGVRERAMEPGRAMPFPLRHPAAVAMDVEVERELELVLNRVGGRTARLARRLIRSSRLRRLARSAADSRVAVTSVRLASRLTQRKPRVPTG
jgi:hypothetical protein